jgi:DNA mismatch repair ATPase MutS
MFSYFKNRKLKKIRDLWDNPKSWEREFSSIDSLFDLTHSCHQHGIVDNKTWADLDMDSIFRKIDTTQTSVGQQYLYRKMRLLENSNGTLEEDYQIANDLRKDRDNREELQACLEMVNKGDASVVTKMLFGTFPIVKLSKIALISWSCLSLSAILYSLLSGGIFIFLILLFLVANFSISRYFDSATDKITYVFYYLYNLISVSEVIAKKKLLPDFYACNTLIKNICTIRKVRKILKFMSISQHHESTLINNAMYLLNLIFLYDLIVYAFSVEKIFKERKIITTCYFSIGAIDTAISTASYLRLNPIHCNPKLHQNNELHIEGAYHPLVEKYVENSIDTESQSALITGSNMAGKTTFIKTIGVNLIFARTLWFCHASHAQLPMVDIFSSIKTEDGLEQGKSFYFSELERLKTFLELAEKDGGYLFLIDEIYRGTNTVERIAGAASVLQELAANNIVFVTTHDIELANYLKDQFGMWFFEETGDRESPFSFKLQSGVCETKNALKLMENMGYPENITERAKAFALELEANDKT